MEHQSKEMNHNNQTLKKSINILSFIWKLLFTWSINKTLNHFGKDYTIRCWPFHDIHVVSNRTDANKILRSQTKLVSLNDNFNTSHGFRYTINNVNTSDDLWRIIHTSVKSSLDNKILQITQDMRTTMDRYVLENLGKEVKYTEFIEHSMLEWFGNFMLGDHQTFIELRKDVLSMFKNTFYKNPFRKVPWLGKYMSYLLRTNHWINKMCCRKETEQKKINRIRSRLSEMIPELSESTFIGSLYSSLRSHLEELDRIEILEEVWIDNVILGFLVYDFVSIVLTGMMFKRIIESRALCQDDVPHILKENFLFPYRGRELLEDTDDSIFKRGDICLMNLLDSSLLFSTGPRSCPGQTMVRPIITEFNKIINSLTFIPTIHTEDYERKHITRNPDTDTPFIDSKLTGLIRDRDLLKKHQIIPVFNRDGFTPLKNIWKLYTDPVIMRDIVKYHMHHVAKQITDGYDIIVAPEARALPLAGILASIDPNNIKPVIVMTKTDKFGPTLEMSYTRGHSDEKTVIHLYKSFEEDVKDKKVLFVDDGLASGGTTLACIKMIEQFKGRVMGLIVMVQHSYCTLDPEFIAHYKDITYSCYDI